jgi:competence protein ComEA
VRAAVSAFFYAWACALVFSLASRALFAQGPLPDGPGRDVTVRVCGECHGADMVASVRQTREGWQETIADMVQKGAKITDEEFATILDYLSTHFTAEARKPLNINTASTVELESVAGLLRKEAAAVVAFIEKNGPCKQLEDLKKVQGLDYSKIEASKERLACVAP